MRAPKNSLDMCGRLADSLTDYLDRALPASEEHDLARHVESCDGCADLTKRTRAAIELLALAGRVEVPAELGWAVKRSVHRAARREEMRPRVRPIPFALSAAAAALLMFATGLPGGSSGLRAGGGSSTLEASEGTTHLERYAIPASVNFRLPADAARELASTFADGPDSVNMQSPVSSDRTRPVKYPF